MTEQRIALAERVEWWPSDQIRPNPRNARTHSDAQLDALAGMMRKVWTFPCLVTEDAPGAKSGELIAGHGRYEAGRRAGYAETKVLVAENWTQAEIDAYVLFDNEIALLADWDEAALHAEIARIREVHGDEALAATGFDQSAIDAMLNPKPPERQGVAGSLAAAFGVPPFSVLNARLGWWQSRKAAWMALGIQSEVGRADHVEGKASHKGAPRGGGRLYGGRTKEGSFKQATQYGKPKRGKA